MKIKYDDHTIVLPVESGLHLIYDCANGGEFLECLLSYFGQKKKTKCIVFDDEDDLISPKDVELIYFSDKDMNSVYGFKPKTEFNTELSHFIEENQEQYTSIEMIRTNLKELLTDRGLFRFRKILTSGTKMNLEISTANFEVSKILQNLVINSDDLTEQEQMITLYNLYNYIYRKSFRIIYIAFEVDDGTMEWLNSIRSKDALILVENTSTTASYATEFDSLIALSNTGFVEKVKLPRVVAPQISYLFHPIVLKHPAYQNEKIFDLYTYFRDFDRTFMVEFTAAESTEML